MPEIVIIAAVAKNGVIGKDNQLLWHIPEDMKHFREATAGKPVIMGRKTWESLPERFRPLPGRRNLVITRQAGYLAAGADTVESLQAALARCTSADSVFIIGGGEIYAQAMPIAGRLLLTEVDLEPEGDAFFPTPMPNEWQLTSRQTVERSEAPGCAFLTYVRIPTTNATSS